MKTPKKRPKIEPKAPEPENEIEITSEAFDNDEDFMPDEDFIPEKKERTKKTEWHCRFQDCVRSRRPFNKRKNRNDHEEWYLRLLEEVTDHAR